MIGFAAERLMELKVGALTDRRAEKSGATQRLANATGLGRCGRGLVELALSNLRKGVSGGYLPSSMALAGERLSDLAELRGG